MTWLKELDRKELIALIPARAINAPPDRAADIIGEDLIRKRLLPSGKPVAKKAAKKVAGDGPRAKAAKKKAAKAPPRPRYKTIYEGIKREIRILICTDDPKYKALRASLDKHGAKLTTAVVGTIAAMIGSTINVAVGVCVPYVSLLLIAAGAVGKNAYCGTVPIKKMTRKKI